MTSLAPPVSIHDVTNAAILSISEDRITLVELVSDGAGGWLERDATVALDD